MAWKVLASLVFTTALIGCPQELPQPPAKDKTPCTSGKCTIDVTVDAGGCSDSKKIHVSEDVKKIAKGNPKVNIEWTIQTPGYTFVPAPSDGSITSGGITFTKPPPPAPAPSTASQFTDPKIDDHGTKYSMKDANDAVAPADYKYDIHLLQGTTTCDVVDPVIKNGAS